jgi:hypothetical protein
MLQFLNRGRENIQQLKKEDIMIFKNSSGKKFLQMRDFGTKNHQGLDMTKSTEAIIVETNDSQCPVSQFELYLSKLHPHNSFLWQHSRNHFNEADSCWYSCRKIGANTMAAFMSKISEYLHLSQKYTNHCLRATGITVLGRKHFQDSEIASFSGHKSHESLAIYKRTAESVKSNMSAAIHESISLPCNSNNNIPTIHNEHALSTNGNESHFISASSLVATSSDIINHNENTLDNDIQGSSSLLKISEDDGFNLIDFDEIDKICKQHSTTKIHEFRPNFSNCTNVTFNFNFHN